MKKILAILAVMMLVFVSGCIGGDDTPVFTQGYGLEITNFSSSLGTIYSTQTTHISLRVENHGDTKALKDNGLVLLMIPVDWEVTQDLNQQFKKDISFANPNTGTEPGSSYFTWSVRAPEMSAGITRPDTIRGRVFYDYETKATGNIIVYPESELLSDKEAGRDIDTSSFKYSRGPIAISMSAVPDPVSVYSDNEIFSLTFEFTNIGGGVVYRADTVTVDSYGIADENRNVIDMDVEISGLVIDETCFDDIMFFGNSATTICDVTVESVPLTRQSFPVRVSATYGYYVEDTLDVEIVGKN